MPNEKPTPEEIEELEREGEKGLYLEGIENVNEQDITKALDVSRAILGLEESLSTILGSEEAARKFLSELDIENCKLLNETPPESIREEIWRSGYAEHIRIPRGLRARLAEAGARLFEQDPETQRIITELFGNLHKYRGGGLGGSHKEMLKASDVDEHTDYEVLINEFKHFERRMGEEHFSKSLSIAMGVFLSVASITKFESFTGGHMMALVALMLAITFGGDMLTSGKKISKITNGRKSHLYELFSKPDSIQEQTLQYVEALVKVEKVIDEQTAIVKKRLKTLEKYSEEIIDFERQEALKESLVINNICVRVQQRVQDELNEHAQDPDGFFPIRPEAYTRLENVKRRHKENEEWRKEAAEKRSVKKRKKEKRLAEKEATRIKAEKEALKKREIAELTGNVARLANELDND